MGDGMGDAGALLVLFQYEEGKWLVYSARFGSTDALLLCSGSCFYVLGVVCFAKENLLVIWGGKDMDGRVRDRSNIISA